MIRILFILSYIPIIGIPVYGYLNLFTYEDESFLFRFTSGLTQGISLALVILFHSEITSFFLSLFA